MALENLNAQILPDNIRTAINDIVKELGWAVENEGQPESLGDTSVMTESFEESKESSDCSRQDGGEIPVPALGDIQIHNEYEANI